MGTRAWAALLLCVGCGSPRTEDVPELAPQGVCEALPTQPASYPERIAAVACHENQLWYGPFIDHQGRLASHTVAEAERMPLQDGATPAWRRVADYWRESGLLWELRDTPGASDCVGDPQEHLTTASCRVFVIDTPWSAAFVSYVMARAGVPGFRRSPSHIDYVRDAHGQSPANPYVLADPVATRPGQGDLLCYARHPEPLMYAGLLSILDNGADRLEMHCDIVVAANPGGDSRLYLVGGNLLQGVTMRVLPLNSRGLLWNLPQRAAQEAECEPRNLSVCSFNRQDWVALLKLRQLPAPPVGLPPLEPAPCCTQCTLPMPPNMRRCPPERSDGDAGAR